MHVLLQIGGIDWKSFAIIINEFPATVVQSTMSVLYDFFFKVALPKLFLVFDVTQNNFFCVDLLFAIDIEKIFPNKSFRFSQTLIKHGNIVLQ